MTAAASGDARRKAIGRALAQGGAQAVRRVRYGLYRVASSSRPGAVHTVSVDAQGRYRCSCEAGLLGKPCWHTAAVFIAKIEHGGGRVTGPAPAPVAIAESPTGNVVTLRALPAGAAA